MEVQIHHSVLTAQSPSPCCRKNVASASSGKSSVLYFDRGGTAGNESERRTVESSVSGQIGN